MDTALIKSQASTANKEKNWAATSSMLAAIFLTVIKIVVGILTGSLGILAEAAHSALDLAAAAMTYFAVKISSRPADSNHTYGHGKVENLSALFETLMLLATSALIIYEAIDRLFFHQVTVQVNFWSFLVMAVSIAVNISRADLLSKVAKKYSSQALEADALHFLTDIWSSVVVILGLGFIIFADIFHIGWLMKGDSIAAIIVAVIVIYASYELGRRAIGELLDEVPSHLPAEISQIAKLQGVEKVETVRLHRSGASYFVDLAISVNRNATSEQAHTITQQVEQSVQALIPGANVLVHVDPVRMEDERLLSGIKAIAMQLNASVHHLRNRTVQGQKILTIHLDIDDGQPVETAYQTAACIKEMISKTYPEFTQIWIHLEPVYRQESSEDEMVYAQDATVEKLVHDLPTMMNIDGDIHEVILLEENGQLGIACHLSLRGDITVQNAHEQTDRMEALLRSRISNLGQVMIQVEPIELIT